jgi:WD40 repeat protein
MIRKNMLPVLIIFILTGCAANPSISTSLPASQTPILTATNPPTVMPTLTSVMTATPEAGFTQQCLQVIDQEIALKDVTSGTVLFYTGFQKWLPFLVDIQTDKKYKLPVQSEDSEWGGFQVSPDRNMFAYLEDVENGQLDSIKSILWVVNAHGDVLVKTIFNRTDLFELRWLDNQYLLFYTDQTQNKGTVLVFNPFTYAQTTIANELPLLDTEDMPTLGWRAEYSPDLKWVVYFGRLKEIGIGPIMRDVVQKQTIWEASTWSYEKPVWSPDGNFVAVISNGRLYIIDRSGQARAVIDENLNHQVSKPSWSPDGNYIAFWNNNRLMLYNRQKDQVLDICLQNDVTTHKPPLWLPNSKQLVVDVYLEQGDTIAFGALVDIQKNVVYKLPKIPQTTYPYEWMNSLP